MLKNLHLLAEPETLLYKVVFLAEPETLLYKVVFLAEPETLLYKVVFLKINLSHSSSANRIPIV